MDKNELKTCAPRVSGVALDLIGKLDKDVHQNLINRLSDIRGKVLPLVEELYDGQNQSALDSEEVSRIEAELREELTMIVDIGGQAGKTVSLSENLKKLLER